MAEKRAVVVDDSFLRGVGIKDPKRRRKILDRAPASEYALSRSALQLRSEIAADAKRMCDGEEEADLPLITRFAQMYAETLVLFKCTRQESECQLVFDDSDSRRLTILLRDDDGEWDILETASAEIFGHVCDHFRDVWAVRNVFGLDVEVNEARDEISLSWEAAT